MSAKTTLDMVVDLRLQRAQRIAEGVKSDSIQIQLLNFQIKRLEAQYEMTQTHRWRWTRAAK